MPIASYNIKSVVTPSERQLDFGIHFHEGCLGRSSTVVKSVIIYGLIDWAVRKLVLPSTEIAARLFHGVLDYLQLSIVSRPLSTIDDPTAVHRFDRKASALSDDMDAKKEPPATCPGNICWFVFSLAPPCRSPNANRVSRRAMGTMPLVVQITAEETRKQLNLKIDCVVS